MTLFGRIHRHPPGQAVASPSTWIAAGLGLTSLLLARVALRLAREDG